MNEYYGVATTPTDDFLAHWGVKGMKWGVRKAVNRTGNGRPHSKGYADAQKKLARITRVGGAIGGIAGGVAGAMRGGMSGGFMGGALGGAAGSIASGLGYYATHKKQLQKSAPTRADYNRAVKQRNARKNTSVKLSKKDERFLSGMKKAANRGGFAGALTVGGGVGGGAIATARYIKQHPKEYAAYKKKYKQMSFKDRMKATWS